jgi:hypothetical protein
MVGNTGINQLINKMLLFSLLAHTQKCLIEREKISKGINKHCKKKLV